MEHSTVLLEELAINAQPSSTMMLMDGWIARFNDGYTKRGNSIQALYPFSMNIDEKLLDMECLYKQKGLPVIYKLTNSSNPTELDSMLEKKGYNRIDETSVQTLALSDWSPLSTLAATVEIYHSYTEEWLQHYCQWNQVDKANHSTLIHMLRTIIPDTCYVLLKEGTEVVACGLGVLQGKYIGLFDIVTNSNYRRKGYGNALVQAILQWGKNEGAEFAYLQVMIKNEAAWRLYQACGFQESYRYWYRIKK
ncbi:MAG: GNAT family N-acetyltransferase [Bacillus sp. (in: firmicutes)]